MTKYETLINKALETLKTNDDVFCEMVDEMDSWNGYADGFRAYDMSEIDDFYCDCKASKLLEDLTSDFNKYDDYFYFSIYGLESTNDKVQLYRDNVDEGELLDEIIENANNLYFYDHDFEELINEIQEAREAA